MTNSQRSSRRPPRKSTLTQQQKNHKRQRATQDQLVTLESEFNKNPTPTAAVRERIADEINMTERSVQIWFQNRRAKIKMIAKRGIETGEDCDAVPESMRQYLAMHFDPTKSRNLFNRAAGYGPNEAMMNGPTSNGKIVISHFSCRSLRVGTWRRVGQNTMDLVIFYSPDKSCMTYYINNDSAGYKIEYPFSAIKSISLESGEPVTAPEGAAPKFGGIVIELNRPPNFYMDSSNSGGFYQCGDFTEDQQATKSLVHHLGGHPKVLSVQLAKLVSLDSFQNRHAHYNYNGFAASAPVSPHIIHRPASQPNGLMRAPSAMYQESNLGIGLHPNRGHKRQRSRSVPVPVDFSAMPPMPSFHVQHPSTQFQPNPTIFAPVPQAHPHMNLGPDLRVDTSASYGMDFHNYPMTATTAPTSGFASPSPFATSAPMDQPQPAQLGTPFSLPFLSPSPMIDHSNAMAHSTSPLSHVSHGEPTIADHSPPLTTTQRSPPADMYSVPTDPACSLPDDGLLLSEMYSKQNLNVSIPSPGMDDSTFALTLQGYQDQESPEASADYHGMLPFESLDPSSLTTEA